MDIKDCEQAKSGNCCYCKNMEYHKLQQKLEKIKEIVEENCSCTRCEDLNCCDGCEDENYRRILQIIEK